MKHAIARRAKPSMAELYLYREAKSSLQTGCTFELDLRYLLKVSMIYNHERWMKKHQRQVLSGRGAHGNSSFYYSADHKKSFTWNMRIFIREDHCTNINKAGTNIRYSVIIAVLLIKTVSSSDSYPRDASSAIHSGFMAFALGSDRGYAFQALLL